MLYRSPPCGTRHRADRELLKLMQEEYVMLPAQLLGELVAGAILAVAGEQPDEPARPQGLCAASMHATKSPAWCMG